MNNNFSLCDVKTNYTFKPKWLILVLLLSLITNSLMTVSFKLEGIDIGYILFPILLLSMVPPAINFSYFLLVRFCQKFGLQNDFLGRITTGFKKYYTFALILHSLIFTFALGLVSIHIWLLIQKTAYCVIFFFFLCMAWLIEYNFWMNNWPLYTSTTDKKIFLYWTRWFLLLGTFTWLILHTGSFKIILMVAIGFLYFILFWIISQDLANRLIDAKTKNIKQVTVDG